MQETSDRVFSQLITYAADRDVQIPVGKRRIFLNEHDYDRLSSSTCPHRLKLGRHTAAGLLKTEDGDLLIFAGFGADDIERASHIREVEVEADAAVAALADLDVEPTASATAVLDVVAAGSAADTDYPGHELSLIQGLYPRLRAVRVDAGAAGEEFFEANVLCVTAAESSTGNGWINAQLSREIVSLGEQRIAGFPYEFLIRAVLDLDPRNLFLALYRCLEATYAFTRATELAHKLGISETSWVAVAKAVGETLSWYPRHDQSLAAILLLPAVDNQDLEDLASALGKIGTSEISTRVAMGIRELRNSLVHYGPTTHEVLIPQDDWNGVCTPLARIVGCVFAHAYNAATSGNSSLESGTTKPSQPSGILKPGAKPRRQTGLERLLEWRLPGSLRISLSIQSGRSEQSTVD